MLNSFKDLELLRHQVSSRLDKSIKRNSSQNRSNAERISGTIFSVGFSLFVAYLSHQYIEHDEPSKAAISFVLFVVAYIVAFFVFIIASRAIETLLYNIRRHDSELTLSEIKEYIDRFDHIACDNNLVGIRCMRKLASQPDSLLEQFDFFELLYYVNVSADVTLSILDHANVCVNTLSKTGGIDLYRIYDQLNMMKHCNDFMLSYVGKGLPSIHRNLKLVLISQIVDFSSKLDDIERKCDELLNKNFSDSETKSLLERYGTYLEKRSES